MSHYYRDPDVFARAVEAATRRSYVVGVDLGSARDYTAIAALEVVETPDVEIGVRVPVVPDYIVRYELRDVDRLPLGQNYTDIVDQIVGYVNTAPLRGCVLAVDFSGVGRPVFSMMEEAGLAPVGVQITGGNGWSKEGRVFNVAKSHLMSNLMKAIHKRTLRIPPDLPHVELVRQELQDLRTSTTAAGVVKVAAQEGRHDDIALSIAVATFVAAHRPKPASHIGYGLGYTI